MKTELTTEQVIDEATGEPLPIVRILIDGAPAFVQLLDVRAPLMLDDPEHGGARLLSDEDMRTAVTIIAEDVCGTDHDTLNEAIITALEPWAMLIDDPDDDLEEMVQS